MTLSTGTKLSHYEITSQIGKGVMGDVWKARDAYLGRTVAIKKVQEKDSARFKQEVILIAGRSI